MRFGEPLTALVVAAWLILEPKVVEAQVTGAHLDVLPPAYVNRSLVLPSLWMTGELDGSVTHFEAEWGGPFGIETNGGWLDLGGALGVVDDFEVEVTLASVAFGEIAYSPLGFYEGERGPFGRVAEPGDLAWWGMSKVGATFRFLAADAAEMGLRFRLLVDRDATIGLNGGVPILLHGNGIGRIDTGVAFVGRVPTSGAEGPSGVVRNRPMSFGLVDVSQSPMSAEAGIPVRVALQAIDELWFGIDTGFGAFDVSAAETIFVPLGARVGATIPLDGLVVDLEGAFRFPQFLLPAAEQDEDQFRSELWQAGLALKIHGALSPK